MLAQTRLQDVLHYDPDNGVFTWRVRKGRIAAGSVAGVIDNLGYVRICVDQKDYRAHRLAHLWMTGEWPEADMDHIDGVRANNRWKNLRSVTRSVNLQNRHNPIPASVTGFLGVSLNHGKFRARIKLNGKQIGLGNFGTPEEAHAAYLAAKRVIHAGCTI